VVYVALADNKVPPVAALYHSNDPLLALAVNVAELPEQTTCPAADGAGTAAFTVTVTATRALLHDPLTD